MKNSFLFLVIIAISITIAYLLFESPAEKKQNKITALKESALNIITGSDNKTADRIGDFINADKIKLIDDIDSVFRLENRKDTLYVFLASESNPAKSDSFSTDQLIHLGLSSDYLYRKSILVMNGHSEMTTNYKGLLFLAGNYLHGCYLADNAELTLGHKILLTEFINKILLEMGGSQYAELIAEHSQKMQHGFEQTGQIIMDETDANNKLSTMFNCKTQEEEDFYAEMFWLNCAFSVYDNQDVVNPTLAKISYLIELGA